LLNKKLAVRDFSTISNLTSDYFGIPAGGDLFSSGIVIISAQQCRQLYYNYRTGFADMGFLQ